MQNIVSLTSSLTVSIALSQQYVYVTFSSIKLM
jgi:hypothetical protein